MASYVAFLRGIGPGNPNMANDKLRGVLEELGFSEVQSFISSGNLIFKSDETDIAKLEEMMEQAWTKKLGFSSTTVVRSKEQLQKVVDNNPFEGLTHSQKTYLLVTFFKKPAKLPFKTPHHPEGSPFYLPAGDGNVMFSVSDTTKTQGATIMVWLERQFGKEITSRTWLTVQRILKRMDEGMY